MAGILNIVLKRDGRTARTNAQSPEQRIEYVKQRAMAAGRDRRWELESDPVIRSDQGSPERYEVTFAFRYKGRKPQQFDAACDQLSKLVLAAGRSSGFKSGSFHKSRSTENATQNKVLPVLASQVLNAVPARWGNPPEDFSIRTESWHQLHFAVETASPAHLIGPTGCGKTTLVRLLADRRRQPLEVINVGDLGLDPSGLLKGERELRGGQTVFEPARFAQALQTPNTLVFLDEWTRAQPAVKNLFLPLLDDQRELKLDGTKRLTVADGVSFIAASNAGGEYAGTFRQDAAQEDRFRIVLLLDYPGPDEEFRILRAACPSVDKVLLRKLCRFAAGYRADFLAGQLTVPLTTRTMKFLCTQLSCGLFSIDAAFEHVVLNRLSWTADSDEERARVLLLKQIHFA